ncbi:ATP-binding protein [Peptostreptococcus porci]|uniref:ATP-binding protein n=1 Tax=Peptostreptococcus porci TaxID=2652282 RepID=UPI002A7F3DCE|nr:ATP-binding protein [Peptostreptococcus porci]MDY4128755.1 ATP-binding protein [Peptostreptococcus porci]MDY4561568.1 ATP-binding protein [Peptostreptococcus porci]MDY5436276.1 ATP-binding protein [Peptostreptococcus porci]MDY5478910.1 ATP-binding protein [Peptostreptococcus porci]MDY6231587.1 ATP-binding protein [Peptostreptococcus porci]
MSCDKISMKLTSNPNFVSVIRLTVSGIASKIGFSFDEIEDLKVSISEACTNAIKHSKEDLFEINFYIYEDKLSIEVIDDGVGYDEDSVEDPDPLNPKTSGLGLFIIKTLMDEVEVKTCEDCGTIIKMTKLVGVDN